jgi:hypothetical protein
MVVENAQVKSGRSILITSGAASGKVCMTPTRVAIEATEHYRQANNLMQSRRSRCRLANRVPWS